MSSKMLTIGYILLRRSCLQLNTVSVTQFEAVWDSHRQPLAPVQGEESPAPELQGPGEAAALQDPAHRHLHPPVQGGCLHYIHIGINIII